MNMPVNTSSHRPNAGLLITWLAVAVASLMAFLGAYTLDYFGTVSTLHRAHHRSGYVVAALFSLLLAIAARTARPGRLAVLALLIALGGAVALFLVYNFILDAFLEAGLFGLIR